MQTTTHKTVSDNQNTLRHDIELLKQTYAVKTQDGLEAVCDRVEKMSSALYIVTAHLPSDEPVVYALRTTASDLIEHVYATSTNYVRDQKVSLTALLITLQRAVAHVRMAMIAQLVSDTNALLLERELLKVHSTVNSMFHVREREGFSQAGEQSVAALFESVPVSPVAAPVQRAPVNRLQALQSAFSPIASTSKISSPVDTSRLAPKVMPAQMSTQSSRAVVDNSSLKSETQVQAAVATTSSSRTIAIMNQLRTKPELTIRDLGPLFPGVSEKTIQRDLQSLSSRGMVKKTGERRWAKYSLSQ
jgi:DNA-binding HxlR family transcriptional regulator